MGVMETQAVRRGNNWTSHVSQVQCQGSGFEGAPIRHHLCGSPEKEGGGGAGRKRCEWVTRWKQKATNFQVCPGLFMMTLSEVYFLVLEKPLFHWAATLHGMRWNDVMPLFFHVGGGSRTVWGRSSCPVFFISGCLALHTSPFKPLT